MTLEQIVKQSQGEQYVYPDVFTDKCGLDIILSNDKLHAEINIVMNTGDYQTEYIPDLYDFSVIDFTDVHPDDGNSENKVVIEMFR